HFLDQRATLLVQFQHGVDLRRVLRIPPPGQIGPNLVRRLPDPLQIEHRSVISRAESTPGRYSSDCEPPQSETPLPPHPTPRDGPGRNRRTPTPGAPANGPRTPRPSAAPPGHPYGIAPCPSAPASPPRRAGPGSSRSRPNAVRPAARPPAAAPAAHPPRPAPRPTRRSRPASPPAPALAL